MLTSRILGSVSCGIAAISDGVNLRRGGKFRHHCDMFSSSVWMSDILTPQLDSGDLMNETTEDLYIIIRDRN
jgi:hypothetical protein